MRAAMWLCAITAILLCNDAVAARPTFTFADKVEYVTNNQGKTIGMQASREDEKGVNHMAMENSDSSTYNVDYHDPTTSPPTPDHDSSLAFTSGVDYHDPTTSPPTPHHDYDPIMTPPTPHHDSSFDIGVEYGAPAPAPHHG